MLGFLFTGAIWLLLVAPVHLLLMLVGIVWAAVAAAASLLILAVRPAVHGGSLTVAIGIVGLAATLAGAAAALGVGRIDVDARLGELREADQNALAIEIEDRAGRWLGVLPQPLMPAAARRAPHIAIRIAPGEAPELWWQCARFLEDRHIESLWHYDGIDFVALVRAYIGRVTGRTHQGGSTISQMLARALRGVSPDPAAGLFDQVPRKWRAWSDGPAISQLYPSWRQPSGARSAFRQAQRSRRSTGRGSSG